MKLAERLKLQLKKTLLLAVGLGVVALILSIVGSTVQTKNRANQFLLASIEEIAQSEVASQNVTDIDREVRKLYAAWKSTQDIDTRIEVYFNGRLISNAGPLSHFGVLSYGTEKLFKTPSGDNFKVLVDLDLSRQVFFDLVTFIIFLLFLIGGYSLIRKKLYQVVQTISDPLEERVAWLTQASRELSRSVQIFPSFEKTDLEEVRALDASLKMFVDQIEALEETVARANFDKGQVEMAEKFAHSIKGSISTLTLRIQNSSGLSIEDRERLHASVNAVADASKTLLKSNRSVRVNAKKSFTHIKLAGLLEKLIEDRKELLDTDSPIKISLTNSALNGPTMVFASETDLISAFNNILDNAVEAIQGPGEVVVKISANKDLFEVKISDNGQGISTEILPKLMLERFTFGKPDGNGFGLYHSRQIIEEANGKIELRSTIGVGTEVTIRLPLVMQETSQNIIIPLNAGATLVVLDDQDIIHQSVKLLLKGEKSLNLVHLYSIQEFENWFSINGPGELGSRTYWMDYDLNHPSKTGLSLIEQYGLQFESYLVTGVAHDPDVVKRTKAESIRLISKSEISNIQFLIKPVSEAQEMVLESGLG